jgi:methylated-DNA-[protein]-cysteine S-methyltransferase
MVAALLTCERLPTPMGELVVVSDEAGCLRIVEWADSSERTARLVAGAGLAPAGRRTRAAAALAAYLGGELAAIDDLPMAATGTAFQRRVWAALRRIPCGHTMTYGELARRIGQPAAVRAVGHANGANPVSIVVPCHRLVGVDGALTGYAGGLARKRWLLAHEGAAPAGPRSGFTLDARADISKMVEVMEPDST